MSVHTCSSGDTSIRKGREDLLVRHRTVSYCRGGRGLPRPFSGVGTVDRNQMVVLGMYLGV